MQDLSTTAPFFLLFDTVNKTLRKDLERVKENVVIISHPNFVAPFPTPPSTWYVVVPLLSWLEKSATRPLYPPKIFLRP